MTIESRIEHLKKQIEVKLRSRAKLMEVFVDAPTSMESKSDHTRQDIATEISVIDGHIQTLRRIVLQLEALDPDESHEVQIGHTVSLQVGDGEPERFLLLDDLGGLSLEDVSTLSVDTPIGDAIVGRRPGDRVDVSAPGGQLTIRILSIE